MTTAICIATGPSLTRSDVERCKGMGRIYAVKEAYKLAPWADVLYAADGDWWESKNGCPDFKGEKWTADERVARALFLEHIEVDCEAIWCEGDCIASGGNSGFQAINLAANQGATKIILLGYDMQRVGMLKHWYDDDKTLARVSRSSNYRDWLRRMRRAAELIPVPVLNATRETAIDCFPRVTLKQAFDA